MKLASKFHQRSIKVAIKITPFPKLFSQVYTSIIAEKSLGDKLKDRLKTIIQSVFVLNISNVRSWI